MLFWKNILSDFSMTDVFNFWEIIEYFKNLKKKTISHSPLEKFILSVQINFYV